MAVEQQIENLAAQTSAGVMYGSSGTGFILAFFNTNAAGVCAIVAIAGFFVNWYYRYKADKRARQ